MVCSTVSVCVMVIFSHNDILRKNVGRLLKNPTRQVLHREIDDPRGPLRLCVLGPYGSGKTTQSEMVAADFNVVHVNVNAVVGS